MISRVFEFSALITFYTIDFFSLILDNNWCTFNKFVDTFLYQDTGKYYLSSIRSILI